MSLHNVPFGDIEKFNVVVEISAGSQDKYEVDEDLGIIKLDRVLYGSQRFPTNYGYIPETRAADGDHTDVLLLSTNPLIPGCVAEARAIGFMGMVDAGETDNKIVAVVAADPRFKDILALEDLPEHKLKEIQNFFETYKALQKKDVQVSGFQDAAAAKTEIEATRQTYLSEAK